MRNTSGRRIRRAINLSHYRTVPITLGFFTHQLEEILDTPRFPDRFGRRASIFAAKFIGKDSANILVNHFDPLWGCLPTQLSDGRPQFMPNFPPLLVSIAMFATSRQELSTSRERWYQMYRRPKGLQRISNRLGHLPPPHRICIPCNSGSASTGLGPNEVVCERCPRLPFTHFSRLTKSPSAT